MAGPGPYPDDRGKGDTLPLSRVCTPNSSGLRAEDLCIRRRGAPVIEGIDLQVLPGAQVAVCGPNGAGKSTLLLALKGLLHADGGRVTLDGGPVERSDLRVGLVLGNPEDQGVCPVVEDDVAFGLENSGMPPARIRERVEAALRSQGLWELRNAPVQTLSGGQGQKLALASVLALGAQYLLLDEATSMLSPWDREGLLTGLAGLRKEGVGVVCVTHEAEELLWAERVVYLNDRRIAFEGSPAEFFRWPDCPLSPPACMRMADALARSGVESPPYPELVQWLGERSL